MVFMLAPTFEGTLAVQRIANMPDHTGVRERVIPNNQMKNYSVLEDEESALHRLLHELKSQMLTEGATHEAVRLVGEHIPISEEEYKVMAEKLTKKPATKKAPAKKAAPAAKAPATEGAARRGRQHSLDDKAKIVLTEKGEAKLKKGAETGATANIKAMKAAKTVGKALEAGLKPGDIAYAVKTGTIELAA